MIQVCNVMMSDLMCKCATSTTHSLVRIMTMSMPYHPYIIYILYVRCVYYPQLDN